VDAGAAAELPSDVNNASLRVSAIDTLYELDLSIEQLNVLHTMASGLEATTARSPGEATPEFIATLKRFQTALLDGTDDHLIAGLRNDVIDMADSSTVHLDDGISPTAAARAKAAAVTQRLKASQIAAYLAVHADEVSDPEELMMTTADALQEIAGEPAEKNADTGGSAEEMIQETASTVGYLVAGMDESKSAPVQASAAAWLRNVSKLTNAEFTKQRQTLEDSAKRIVGGTSSTAVLDNWLDRQIAVLMSNPQLPSAIDAILKVRTQNH
jgi:hypothetical protein